MILLQIALMKQQIREMKRMNEILDIQIANLQIITSKTATEIEYLKNQVEEAIGKEQSQSEQEDLTMMMMKI